MSRTLLFVVVLVVAAGAPYLITKSKGLVGEGGTGGVKSVWTRLTGAATERFSASPSDLSPISEDDTLPGRADPGQRPQRAHIPAIRHAYNAQATPALTAA